MASTLQPDDAQTIQQMATELVAGTKQVVGTTFSDLIFGNFSDPWALVAIGLISALVGMFTHWAKVHFSEPNTVGFYQWFFVTNKKGSLIAILTMLGALFATFGPLDYTTITAYQVFTQAWAIGYAADSVFNSANRDRYSYGNEPYSNGYEPYTPGYPQGGLTGGVPGYGGQVFENPYRGLPNQTASDDMVDIPDRPPSASHM